MHLKKKDRPTVAQRIGQTGADRGARSGKSGQSNYFVGYKKHSACGLVLRQGRFCRIPLCSLARPASLGDVEMLGPLVEAVGGGLNGVWPLGLVIADKGYIQGEQASQLRQRRHVALVVAPKKSMVPPPGCDAQGCPLCPAGEALAWEDYDSEGGGWLIYRGAPALCARCPLAGDCARQFEFAAGAHETFWGMVPSHSRLSRELLRKFRPRVEQGFNLAKNKFRLKGFFLNSLELAQILCVMCDILETLGFLAQERPQQGRETKIALQGELQAPDFFDFL